MNLRTLIVIALMLVFVGCSTAPTNPIGSLPAVEENIPWQPTDLVAEVEAPDSTTARLKWIDNSLIEKTYEVWIASNSGVFVPCKILPSNTEFCIIDGLNKQHLYIFAVHAVNNQYFSQPAIDSVNTKY